MPTKADIYFTVQMTVPEDASRDDLDKTARKLAASIKKDPLVKAKGKVDNVVFGSRVWREGE